MTDELDAKKPQALSPAVTFLARYTNEGSRLTMRKALQTVATAVAGGDLSVDAALLPWHQVTYQHALAVKESLVKRGLKPATVNRCMGALRGVMDECVRLDLVPLSVASNIRSIPPVRESTQKAGRALTDDEVSRLYAACDPESPRGARDAALLVFTHAMGVRRSEAASLTLKDWTPLPDGSVEVEVLGKRQKYRKLFIAPAQAKLVAQWLKHRGQASGPLLTPVRKDGAVRFQQKLTDSGIYCALQELGSRAGIASFTPHDLRRTFITKMLALGVDPLTVAELAGHESVTTTQRYDRRTDETKRAASKTFAAALAPPVEDEDDDDEDEELNEEGMDDE